MSSGLSEWFLFILHFYLFCLFRSCCLLKTPLSRLLWQPVLLLCGSLCLPGRKGKKTPTKNTGPAADATCTFVCAWVCARTVASGYSVLNCYCGPADCCSELKHSVSCVANSFLWKKNLFLKLRLTKGKVWIGEKNGCETQQTWQISHPAKGA